MGRLEASAKSIGRKILPKEVKRKYKKYRRDKIENSVIIFVMDSCRYDSFEQAYDSQFPAKKVRKAHSPSNWTIPSHESIIRGFLPFGDFENPIKVFEPKFGTPLPNQFDYSFGVTAIPYLSSSSFIENHFHRHFDDYYCEEELDSADRILKRASRYLKRSDNFIGLVNFGETHSPYKNHSETELDELLDKVDNGKLTYDDLQDMQKESAEYLIEKIRDFLEEIPEGTLVIVTADHGELFGEKGGFGHNPHKRAVYHKALYEVPLIYWHN